MNGFARRLWLKPLEDRLAPATLTGTAFADYDGDGTRDAIERGQAAVTVRLDLNGDGTFDATTTTAKDGSYSFTGVADGSHKVAVTVPAGFTPTGPTSLGVVITGNGDAKNLDFALRPNGQILGTAFEDANFNGTFDAGEAKLAGVAVTLDLFGDGLSILTATTTASGAYTFAGVPNGTHTLAAELLGYSSVTANPIGVNIANAASVTVNPGFAPAAVVRGFAFSDLNKNGALDPGERLLPGLTAQLDRDNNGSIDATAVTDIDGRFHFSGVPDGKHKVTISGVTAAPAAHTITVNNADVSGLAFAVTPTGTLSGVAFLDANANQIQDAGEAGLSGVTVTIDFYGDSSIDATVVTGSDGKYAFTGIPDGAHTVRAVRTGYINTTPVTLNVTYAVGSMVVPNTPGNSNRTPGDPTLQGPLVPTRFGLALPAIISGFVYGDTNKDGQPTLLEPELAGVTVQLDLNNNGIFDRAAVTDKFGNFAFSEVPNGTHKIAITLPAGFTAAVTTKTVTITGGTASTANAFPLQSLGQVNVIAVSTDSPLVNQVRLYSKTGTQTGTFAPFATVGDTRVATGDVNGDGIEDFAVATGPGRVTQVRVLDGATQAELFSINPFGTGFFGGAYVALGDLDGDGRADLAITPDVTGGPRVRVFRGGGFSQIADFFGIDDVNFRGGARAAIGDLNNDGKGDLLISAGFGGGPRVALYDGSKLTLDGGPKFIGDFFAFEPDLRNGAYLAAGDVNGDGFDDLIAGAGIGGAPRITVFSGKDLINNTQTRLADFFAGGQIGDRSGVRLAVTDADGDGFADIVAGYRALPTFVPRLVVYAGKNIGTAPTPVFDIEPFPGYLGTIFVG